MYRRCQPQRRPWRLAVGQRAAHLGTEVLEVRELQQRRPRLDVEDLAQRPERLAYRVDRVGVLFVVLRRGQQFLAQGLVLCRVGPARQRPAEHQRADLIPGAPDEQFGGGADHAVAGERKAVRIAAGQPPQQDPRVDGLLGGSEHVAGEHHLAQAARLDRADGLGHRPLPARPWQAAVLPADSGRRGQPGVRGRRPGSGYLASFGDRGEPGPATAVPAQHRARDDQDRTVRRGVEREGAERDRARAAYPDRVVDVGGVEHRAKPLLSGGEPVVAGRERDPDRLAPAGQAGPVMHPGDHVRLGDALEQVPGIGDCDGTDD